MTQLAYTNIFDAIKEDKQEAADMAFRADMLLVLRDIFEANNWDQSTIMAELEITQPRASELMRGKVSKFSSDKLIGFLAKLGFRLKPTVTLDTTNSDKIKIECSINYA